MTGDPEKLPIEPPRDDVHRQDKRSVEAYLFMSAEPVDADRLRAVMDAPDRLEQVLADLTDDYRARGVHLLKIAGGWAFRTAPDLGPRLVLNREKPRKLSRAARETLAIVAYHQPITRAELEGIRGVSTNRGTLDILMEAGWVRPGRRKQVPGRPLTWVTTPAFLDHFGLTGLDALPGFDDLQAAGLLETATGVTNLASAADDLMTDADPPDADRQDPGLPFGADIDEEAE